MRIEHSRAWGIPFVDLAAMMMMIDAELMEGEAKRVKLQL